MSNHKLLSTIAVFSIAILVSVTMIVSKTSADLGPEGVARQELPKILQKISNMGLEKYGFKDSSELTSVTLGQSYEVYSLAPTKIRQYQANSRIVPLLTQEQHRVFPVLVNDEPRGLLHVALQDGKWQVVQFGDLPLSQKLKNLTDSIDSQRTGTSLKYSLKIVNIYPIHGVLALIEQNDQELIVPMESYPGSLEYSESTLKGQSSSELMPQIVRALDKLPASRNQEMP